MLGGLGKRNFIDEYSDLDIGLFLSKIPERHFLPPFSFYIKIQNFKFEFNISQHIISSQLKENWNSDQKQAYSNGLIAFDRNGEIQKLLDKKLLRDRNQDLNRLVTLINQFFWRAEHHCFNTFKRGLASSSHLLLNDGLNLLIEAIFILNMREKPHTKWVIEELDQLDFLPNKAIEKFDLATLIKDFTYEDIQRRFQILTEIKKDILNKINEEYKEFPNNTYMYWTKNLSGRQLENNCFAENLLSEVSSVLDDEEKDDLYNFICYHLISDKKMLSDALTDSLSKSKFNALLLSKITKIII